MFKVKCDKCQKLVDKVEWYRDETEMNAVVRVECHGDWQEMKIPDHKIAQLDSESRGYLLKNLDKFTLIAFEERERLNFERHLLTWQ